MFSGIAMKVGSRVNTDGDPLGGERRRAIPSTTGRRGAARGSPRKTLKLTEEPRIKRMLRLSLFLLTHRKFQGCESGRWGSFDGQLLAARSDRISLKADTIWYDEIHDDLRDSTTTMSELCPTRLDWVERNPASSDGRLVHSPIADWFASSVRGERRSLFRSVFDEDGSAQGDGPRQQLEYGGATTAEREPPHWLRGAEFIGRNSMGLGV